MHGVFHTIRGYQRAFVEELQVFPFNYTTALICCSREVFRLCIWEWRWCCHAIACSSWPFKTFSFCRLCRNVGRFLFDPKLRRASAKFRQWIVHWKTQTLTEGRGKIKFAVSLELDIPVHVKAILQTKWRRLIKLWFLSGQPQYLNIICYKQCQDTIKTD